MDRLKLVLSQMTIIQRRRYLYFLKGWTLTKIAQKEGVSVNSVKKSIHFAKKRVGKRLNRG